MDRSRPTSLPRGAQGLNRARQCAVALALCLAATLGARPTQASPAPSLNQWGAVTLFHGLPSDHVRAIAEDADGTLWFGTDGGLARFDGRRTETVLSEAVHALGRGADGALWIGTEHGAARIEGGAPTLIAETRDHDVTAIAAAPDGTTVLGCAEGALFAVGKDGVRRIGADSAPSLETPSGPLYVTSLVATRDGVLVGSRGRGLLRFDGQELREIGGRLRPYFVESLAVDSRGGVWFGAQAKRDDGGVYSLLDTERVDRAAAGSGTVNALCFDDRGDLWVGTDDRGAIRLRDGREVSRITFEGSAGGLRSNRVYTIFVDREGVVWFGTDRGACRYDPRSPLAEPVGPDADGNFVRTMLADASGRVWCGTNRGLFMRDPATETWLAVEGMERRTVYSLAEDRESILAGTGSAVFRIDTRAGEGSHATELVSVDADPANGGVRALRVVDGTIYVAWFGRGLERLDGDALTHVWPQDGDARLREVVSLYSDGDGRLWIGTARAGAFVLDGGTVRPVFEALSSDAVWGMDRAPDGTFWIATARGLFAAVAGRVDLVLEGSETRAVVAGPAPGSAWCATVGAGVFTVSRTVEDGIVASRLDTEHGIPSDAIFALTTTHTPDGETALWIGTNRGVARYGPGRGAAVLRVIRALGARAYGPAEVVSGLALEYPQNSLAVEVAAAGSRTFPEQFQYAFAVYDAKNALIRRALSHDPQIVLDNLKPGRYRVEARAYTNDLVRSEPLGFAFEVEGAPFPWGVAALSGLLGVALLALWWGGWQNRRLAGANRELADTRLQLSIETETERRRISRDLHDETLADLRRLLMLSDGRELPPAELRGEIESISSEIRRICEDLSPSVLANVGLTAALEWALANAVAHLPEDCKFDYEFVCADDLEEQLRFEPAEQIQIYRIVQEAINNVCKHAGAAHVWLTVEMRDADFVVRLEDDGRGFAPTDRRSKTGRGLANIRSRASMIGATVSWSPREGGGMRFELVAGSR